MATFIERVLDHPDLTIELHKTTKGHPYFVGASNKYEPLSAVSDSAWKCFLKFDIPLWEQKVIAEAISKNYR